MEKGSRKRVKFAPWMATVGVTLLIAIVTMTVRGSVRMGQHDQQVQNNTEDIIELREEKASKEKVDMVYDAVIRLEGKFDDYVLENK